VIFDLLVAAAGATSSGGGGGGGTFPVAGAPKLRERVSFRGSLASPFNVTNNPCVVGDLLVFVANLSAAGLVTGPAGWTQLTSATSSIRMQVFTKVADASDIAGATYSWTFTGGGQIAYNLFTFIQSFSVQNVAGTTNITVTDLSSPTITATNLNNIVLGIFTDPAAVSIRLMGVVELSTLASGGTPTQSVGYAEKAASGTTTAQASQAVPTYTSGTAHSVVIGGN